MITDEDGHRVLNASTIRTDITAHELARLMVLEVTYGRSALEAMTPEDRALVEQNSRPMSD